MKRILLITVLVGLFAGQASAALYQMDATTAADMRLLSVNSGDLGAISYIGYKPGLLGDRVFGGSSSYGDTMTLAVGFKGQLEDDDASGDAILTIGLSGAPLAGLSGNFDGFELPLANDNNQNWSFRSFVDDGTNPVAYSPWTALAPDQQANLVANLGGLTDFSTLAGIGFEIKWVNAGSASDDFHASVVPVPAAFLLGLLGFGAAGLKLRRFA